MTIKTKDKIISYLTKNKFAGAHDMAEFLGLNKRSVFKQLKNLLDEGLIAKIGRPPKVLYYVKTSDQKLDIPYDTEFQLIELEDYANYLYVVAPWEGATSLPEKWGFENGRYLGAEYRNKACYLFAPKLEYQKMNQINFSMLFNQTKNWDRLHEITFNNSDKLFSWAKKQLLVDEKKLDDKSLVIVIETLNKFQQEVHCPRLSMWALETPDNLISDYLRSYLEEQAEEIKNVKTKPYIAFQTLSTSLMDSIWTKEEIELIKICQITNEQERLKKIKEHSLKYEWLEYGLQGKIIPFEEFKQKADKILTNKPAVLLKQLQEKKQNLIKDQKNIIEEYSIDKKHAKIFAIVRDSVSARSHSKDAQFFSYYALEKTLREFGRRTNLELEEIRFLAPHEFREALLSNKKVKDIAKKRMKYSLHVSDGGNSVFYYGEEAKKIRKKIKITSTKATITDIKLIKGQPAHKGLVRGRVKIVNTINEIFKVHQGNILVSRMTNPSVVPAMKKAAAIVTDMGGITCHAAIVARELNKPCIIGTKVATEILKDGDTIEVDANNGVIKLLS